MNTYRMRSSIIWIAFIGIIEIIIISAHEKRNDPHEVRENVINLFKSIREKEWNETSNFRKVLQEDVVQDKQVFDTMKDVLRHAPRRQVEKNENLDHINVFKRGVFPDNTGTTSTYKERVKNILKSGSPDSLLLLEDARSICPSCSVFAAIEIFASLVDPLRPAHDDVVDPLILKRLETCEDEELIQYLAFYKLLRGKYLKAVRTIPKLPAYKERVMTILKSGSPDSLSLLEGAKCMWPGHTVERAIELFATSVDILCEEARNRVDPLILKSLQTREEQKFIRDLVRGLFDSPQHKKSMRALEEIIPNLLASSDNQGYSGRKSNLLNGSRDDFCCVRISPLNDRIRKFDLETFDIWDKSILKELFPFNVPRVIHCDKDANGNILSIKVRFKNMKHTLSASVRNTGWLGRVRTQVRMIPCDGFGSSSPPTTPTAYLSF